MITLGRSIVAEFIGTFALIFTGVGAATALGANYIAAAALAHGLMIMVFVSTFGDISGCHINPAITVGLASAGVAGGLFRLFWPGARKAVASHSIPATS